MPLTASAGGDAVEIHLIDGHFNRIEKAVGRLTTDVDPGIYKIKFKAGSLIREIPVLVAEGQGPVHVDAPPMHFSAPVPIRDTSTTREYHEYHSGRLSRERHVELGRGASIFVFVRDLDGRGRASPASGLTLCDLDGRTLVNLGDAAAFGRGPGAHQRDLWAGCTLAVAPGSYRLCCDTGEHAIIEQIVHASTGWQTQVFLTRRPIGEAKRGRRPDLTAASIHMSRLGMGFEPGQRSIRDAELARQALANRRPDTVADTTLRNLLNDKFVNPMLGLYGAYLLLTRSEPPRSLVNIVMGNLRVLLGDDHPDLAALTLHMAHRGLTRRRPTSTATPPMTRSGWDAVIRECAENPDLVAADSLAGRIADRLWGGGPWLTWQRPDKPEPPTTGNIDLAALIDMIKHVGPTAGDSPDLALTPLEAGVLHLAHTLPSDWTADPGSVGRAATALGVPPSVASVAAQSLHDKIAPAGHVAPRPGSR